MQNVMFSDSMWSSSYVCVFSMWQQFVEMAALICLKHTQHWEMMCFNRQFLGKRALCDITMALRYISRGSDGDTSWRGSEHVERTTELQLQRGAKNCGTVVRELAIKNDIFQHRLGRWELLFLFYLFFGNYFNASTPTSLLEEEKTAKTTCFEMERCTFFSLFAHIKSPSCQELK